MFFFQIFFLIFSCSNVLVFNAFNSLIVCFSYHNNSSLAMIMKANFPTIFLPPLAFSLAPWIIAHGNLEADKSNQYFLLIIKEMIAGVKRKRGREWVREWNANMPSIVTCKLKCLDQKMYKFINLLACRCFRVFGFGIDAHHLIIKRVFWKVSLGASSTESSYIASQIAAAFYMFHVELRIKRWKWHKCKWQ